MINHALLRPEVQAFITEYDGPLAKLAFAGSPFENISVQELLQQIGGRRQIEKKLPHWYNTSQIIYPPKENLEQSSSEITAKYKAGLVRGETLADLTGGFGVDTYYFSENFSEVHHFETNEDLSEIAAHNFGVFGKANVKCFGKDGLAAIEKETYSVIYADPSRRHRQKGKVFLLKDCEPDIPSNLSAILNRGQILLLKTSPMLDISAGLQELSQVAEIHIVAVANEVKELLWLIKPEASSKPFIKTVNFSKEKIERFDFEWGATPPAQYTPPQKYLYDPNAAIMKSGAFDLISDRLNLGKLHKNTHLYTSEDLRDFPGRRFRIEETVPYSKAAMRRALNIEKANITTRNFPESVINLRKKWKIKDGGDVYLFFVTDQEDRKQMYICSKV